MFAPAPAAAPLPSWAYPTGTLPDFWLCGARRNFAAVPMPAFVPGFISGFHHPDNLPSALLQEEV